MSVLTLALLANASVEAQGLQDLSFGQADTFEVITWNIEWFPKNGQQTVNLVQEAIVALDVDVLALQEVTDTGALQQMVDGMPGYAVNYESEWFAGLAYVYKTDTIQITDIYEIYTTQPYWSAFPRSPQAMELLYEGEQVVLINNHFKCCGDGVLDLNDAGDEETRRYTASNLLKQHIDLNFPDTRVIVTGDLNDILTDSPANNVFQGFTNDPQNYAFADMGIATGPSADWSFPNWPSHLDHLLITNELFEEFAATGAAVEVIRVDDYLPGGWWEYDSKMSDHRPVGLKLPIGDVGCPSSIAASEVVRAGTPPNPIALLPGQSSGPVIGATWDPVVDHASFQPGALLDVLVLTTLPANLPSGMGTILCNVGAGSLSFGQLAGVPFSLPIPANCNLVGAKLCVQAASVNLASVALTNALDLTIGSF